MKQYSKETVRNIASENVFHAFHSILTGWTLSHVWDSNA